jgi:hypothetical protein
LSFREIRRAEVAERQNSRTFDLLPARARGRAADSGSNRIDTAAMPLAGRESQHA